MSERKRWNCFDKKRRKENSNSEKGNDKLISKISKYMYTEIKTKLVLYY